MGRRTDRTGNNNLNSVKSRLLLKGRSRPVSAAAPAVMCYVNMASSTASLKKHLFSFVNRAGAEHVLTL